MTKKMFIFSVGILVLTFAVYIFAEDGPFQDRPIQQQMPVRQDQPMSERFWAQTEEPQPPAQQPFVDRQVKPLQPGQMLNRWFEAVKKAYHQKDKEGLDRLIRRMDNLLNRREEARVAPPVVQAFNRWFGKFKKAYQQEDAAKMGRLIRRFELARDRLHSAIQNRIEHFRQDRPLPPLQQGDEWLERPLRPMQQLDRCPCCGRPLPQRPFMQWQMDRQDYGRPLPPRQLRSQPGIPEEPLPPQPPERIAPPRPEIVPDDDFPAAPPHQFEWD